MRGHHPDYLLAIAIFILLAVGLVMIYSISPILSHSLVGSADRNYYFLNQIKYVAVGLVGWIIASNISYRTWQKLAPWLMGLAIFFLLLLFTPLRDSSLGATRWLKLGPFTMQPAELLKLALILYLGSWFERRSTDPGGVTAAWLPFTLMVGAASFVVVVLQKDMGTTLVVALAAIGMYYTAGLSLRVLAGLLGGSAIAGWLAIAAFQHRVSRITAFLNPSGHCNDVAYQVCQALVGVGSGGLFGVGLGHSIQVYGYLPEAANDSIFAIIGEEFGLVGAVLIVGLFGYVVYRGLQIARDAPDTFSRLTATGISLWLLFQALINIGAMLSLVPLTGIPLPFISYGGTSLVISLVGAGILLNISKYTVREVTHASSGERRGNRRSYFANSGDRRRAEVAR